MSQKYHVIVIGAGSTGTATAHDLALRGLQITVIERGEIASGTTGRNHCLLHSGGRYAVTDHEGAVECIDENMTLRKIMLDGLELNDGLFVAVDESDLAFKDTFLEAAPNPAFRARHPGQARWNEPTSSKFSGRFVPDGVFDLSVGRLSGHGQEERREVLPYRK
jgi:glycerol-3-phosphate dehydrogenase